MEDSDITILKDTLARGIPLYWMDDKPKEVIKIGPDTYKEHGICEPSEIGFLADGGYIALWLCDRSEFVTMSKIFKDENKRCTCSLGTFPEIDGHWHTCPLSS